MSVYKENIEEYFRRAYKNDQAKYVQKWHASWDYQDIKKNDEFDSYHGPSDLAMWFNWSRKQKTPDYFPEDVIFPFVELSRKYNQKLVKKLRLDNESYNESIDRYNAQDYLFQNSYPVPRRNKISHILDFGAGYGRQANIWSQKRDDILFVGMDAILKS